MKLRWLFLALLWFTHVLTAAPKPPNIVFLLVDDLRWNTLGFMGDKIVQTPHLDKLAAQSVVFDNYFVTTSICCVSRASFFTGQWMRRHGIEDFVTGLNGPAWDVTYPAQLRAAGFRTGFIGKWGVGSPKETAAKAAAFDYWKGLPGQAGEFIEKNDPTRTHKTARFGNEALEFLAGCTKEKPFCLSLSFNAVHARDGKPREFEPDPRDEQLYADVTIPVPKLALDEAAFLRLPESVQKSEGRTRWKWRFDSPEKTQRILRDYYRLITGVDREVGRILAELEKRGFADNTVIFFAGDNGFALGERGMADKWFMYEEDIRVPAFIYDPSIPPAARGRRERAMTLNVDFAPTMLDYAGVPVPPAMQGQSLIPLMRGPVLKWRKEFFYEHHSVAARIPMSEGVRTERWKYLRWIAETPVKEELYDLQADPLEERNLLTDPRHAALLAELRGKWERYGRELR